MKIIDAKEISKNTIVNVGEFYKDKQATVIILSASDDKASEVYVDKKQKAFEEVGVNCLVYDLDEYTTTQDMIEEIQKFNEDDSVTGIMVQHPVYKGIDFREVVSAIDPRKDIDGLHPFNQGMKNYGEYNVLPATSLGVMKILDSHEIDVKGKFVVIVGRGFLVADPLAKALEHRGATVVKIHTKTDVSDKIDLHKENIWNEFLRLIGISNLSFQKKERNISDEIQAMQGGTIASRFSRFEPRKRAIEEINKKFKLEIEVQYYDGEPSSVEQVEEMEVIDDESLFDANIDS